MSNKSNIEFNDDQNQLVQQIHVLLKRLEIVESRLNAAEKDNAILINKNIDLATEIDELKIKDKLRETQLRKAQQKIEQQEKEIIRLNNKLHRKNSRNSSIPPTQDQNRPKKNQSLRKKSGKKPGGQKEHKGHDFKFSENPTSTIDYTPQVCQQCGEMLVTTPLFVKKRQVIDIPPIQPEIIEHRLYKRTCQCGHCNTSSFPKEVKAPISYGPRTEALIAHLSVRQYIPVKRIEEFLKQFFGLKISAATICNKIASCADKLLHYYTWIQDQISKASVVGSDETSCRLNASKAWMWTWQTNSLTYIRFSLTRGFKAIKDTFPFGLPNSFLVHDCLSAQFKTKCKGHQMCTAHLLRELNYFIEKGSIWAAKFKSKIKEALLLHKKIKSNPNKNYKRSINKINRLTDQLLHNHAGEKSETLTFINRIIKKRNALFRFLDHPDIPPDNNASERAIRNVKVKTKVSGMFKSELGAQHFAVIRSVIDTFSKRGLPVMQSLVNQLS